MSELFADINNMKICYEIHGEGAPVLLLHGYAMYKEFWFTQIFDLAKFFKLLAIDFRSCGKSTHPIEPYKLDDVLEDLKGLLDYLGIEKAHFIGHSYGGMIAQNFAIKYPERLNKLILLATIPKFPDISGLDVYKESQIASYKAKLEDPVKAFFDKMKPRFTRKFFKIMVNDPKHIFHGLFSTEDLIELEKKGTSDIRDLNYLADIMGEHDTTNRLMEIQNKTLIIAGDKDKHTPKYSHEQINEKMPNSVLKIVSGAHFFPYENALEVNQFIIDFLKSK
jgi:aminoacrylate hydrolase